MTINSDDPAYFGGYLTDNFCAISRELGVTRPEAVQFSKNAVKASFLDDAGKNKLMAEVEDFATKYLGKGDEWLTSAAVSFDRRCKSTDQNVSICMQYR